MTISRSSDEIDSLTPMERCIVLGVASGNSNAQIADDVGVTTDSVRVRLTKIYSKTQTNSRVALAMFAVRKGWVRP